MSKLSSYNIKLMILYTLSAYSEKSPYSTLHTPVKEILADRDSEQGLRDTAQGLVRAVFIVINLPLIGNDLHLFQACKQMGIEHFSRIDSIETLDERILIRLAGLDISDGNAFAGGPFGERSRY